MQCKSTQHIASQHNTSHYTNFTIYKVRSDLLVVIQYSVHVLDPHSVHRAVKQDPLAVIIGVAGILTECVGQHTYTYQQLG